MRNCHLLSVKVHCFGWQKNFVTVLLFAVFRHADDEFGCYIGVRGRLDALNEEFPSFECQR